jgi:hypothetical protein
MIRVDFGLVSISFPSVGRVVGRVWSVRQATTQQTSEMKPMIRIVQGKPMTGARYSVISENMMPPVPPAVQAMPVAKPCLLENQWPMVETLGVNRRQDERPPKTPKDRRN